MYTPRWIFLHAAGTILTLSLLRWPTHSNFCLCTGNSSVLSSPREFVSRHFEARLDVVHHHDDIHHYYYD